jgi:hypothetical protein
LAMEASPCELPDGPPAVCAFFGTLPADAVCNDGFQCQSGVCNGTAFISPEGQSGPSTCGTCAASTAIGQNCEQTECPVNAVCSAGDAGASICRPIVYGDVGASCDDKQNDDPCKTGLYCAAPTGQCSPFAQDGETCGEGSIPPGNPGGCAPPLSCVGNPGATTCTLGAQGATCLNDIDCAPGLGCRGLHGTMQTGSQPTSGSCQPLAWASPGQPCDLGNTTNCLVGSCGGGPFDAIGMTSDGGPLPGLCPLVIADGQPAPGSPGPMANTYATCDTFAQPFLADFHYMFGLPNGGAYGTCTLFDSVVCK